MLDNVSGHPGRVYPADCVGDVGGKLADYHAARATYVPTLQFSFTNGMFDCL